MGGEINVKSEINEGSKFIVTLQAKAIDKVVICNDEDMDNHEKVEYLESLNAFQYTKNFNKMFTLLEQSQFQKI